MRSALRTGAVLALLTLGACQCQGRIAPAPASFHVPQAVDLGQVPLGETVSREVPIDSVGTAPVSVTLVAEAPFVVIPAQLDVPAGSTLSAVVTWAPTQLGVVDGTLRVSGVDVRLFGEAVPACRSPDACHGVRFDQAAGACVTEALPDDTACADACVTAGHCRTGVCVGAFAACDDGDACTVDGCSVQTGCSHSPRACAVTDPCKVAVCDPASGCGTVDIEDGVACGEQRCATAFICLGGRCAERPRPGVAAGDCEYTQVIASGGYSCALTRTQKVRCWGFVPLAQPLIMPPMDLPEAVGVTDLVEGGGLSVCGPSLGGRSYAHSMPTEAWPDAGALRQVGPRQCGLCGLSGTDFQCFSSTEPPWTLLSDVAAISACSDQAGGVLQLDGGLRWPPTRRIEACSPATALVSIDWDLLVTTLADGGLCSVTNDAQGNAVGQPLPGVAVMGGWDSRLPGGDGHLVVRRDAPASVCASGTAAPCVELPADVVQLTTGFGQSHACAVVDGGAVWCWGNNAVGELGVSTTALEPVRVQVPGKVVDVALDSFDGEALFACADTGLWHLGDLTFSGTDGGLLGASGQTSAAPTQLWSVGKCVAVVAHRGRVCILDHRGEVWCFAPGVPLSQLAVGAPVTALHAMADTRIFGTSDAGAWVYETNFGFGLGGVSSSPCLPDREGRPICTEPDGGLRVPGAPPSLRFVSPGTDCGAAPNGEVWCWYGSQLRAVHGADVGPFVHSVVGDASGGCAAWGVSGVQCWGTNLAYELGRPGPTAAQRVAVPFGERVVRLREGKGSLTSRCAVLESGALWCWGWNGSGQLGVEPRRWTTDPVKVVR